MEEQSDGTLHVFGVVTAERPDVTNEVCDYAKTVPYYKATVAEMLKATDVPGMEQSIMPLREMHQLKAIGKGISIDFDDASKTIRMGFEVVDPLAITKVKKGVLPAFSQGGDYVGEKVPDPVHKGCMRYVANPGEVSLVDRGALPGAVIESMKGRSFPLVKSDGSTELRKFALEDPPSSDIAKLSEADAALIAAALRKTLEEQPLKKEPKTKRKGGKDLHASDFAYVGDPEDTSTWKLPIHDKAHAQNALARFNQTEGIPSDEKSKVKAKIKAAAKKHGIDVAGEAEKIAKAIEYMQGRAFEKGLWDVAQMAEVAQTIAWLQSGALYERDMEGDASTQPEDLKTLLDDAVACLVAMVEEEASELQERAAALSGAKGAIKVMTQEELQKAAGDLEKRTKSLKAHLQTAQEHNGHVSDHLGKCMKALEGDEVEGSGPTPTDPKHGGTAHPGPTGEKAQFVSMGKNVDGVEIFKRAPDPNAVFDAQAFKTELKGEISDLFNETLAGFMKAMFLPEGATKTPVTKAAPGLGDRALVPHLGPHVTQSVTKAQDVTANPGAPDTAKQANEVTKETVLKAAAGDQEAALKLARTIQPMNQAETERVQLNYSNARVRS